MAHETSSHYFPHNTFHEPPRGLNHRDYVQSLIVHSLTQCLNQSINHSFIDIMVRSFFRTSFFLSLCWTHEILGYGGCGGTPRRNALTSLMTTVPWIGTTIISPSVVTAATTTTTTDENLNNNQDYIEDPRGLKYKVITPGTGGKPVRGQKIKTLYTLYLNGFPEDGGKKIDSTRDMFGGQRPFEFNVGVNMVVKGWDLGLMDMSEGESRRLVIPSTLGYGEEGVGGALTGGVPGDATLYFEVTLTELGQLPPMTPDQVKWLEDHPL